MRLLRNPFILKTLAAFHLLLFLNAVFFPAVSYALTNGDTQQEYSSYSDGNSSDMVNLMTGNFSFSLPLVTVPGPDGGFDLPLSYNAGIGLEQEASWLGLGFSMNAGAISRQIVQYPDDAMGEVNSIDVQDPGIRGWTSSLLGIGKIGWNNETGHYGAGSLLSLANFSYSSGDADVGVAGIHVNGYESYVNGGELGMAAFTVASMYAGGAFASVGAFASEAGQQLAIGAVMSGLGNSDPLKGLQADWRYNRKTEKKLLHKNYWVWLDYTRAEEMYGILNLGKMPVVDLPDNMPKIPDPLSYNLGVMEVKQKSATGQRTDPKVFLSPEDGRIKGPASDMEIYAGEDYQKEINPSNLSMDNYSVMGSGISGSIEPYRLDVGSLSVPKDMSGYHTRLALVPFQDYKVQFKYSGTMSNRYVNHAGTTSGDVDVENPVYGLTCEGQDSDPFNNTSMDISFTDLTLESNQTEEDRADRLKGYKDKKLAFGRNIVWYTNQEILNGNAPGFIDFLPSSERNIFRSGQGIGLQIANGIGGYVVTREDGMTYHYSLPIYSYQEETVIQNISNPEKRSIIKRDAPFATTWLLTAVTGPDYKDRGVEGLDEEDWGYWVKLDYGKTTDDYTWRIPYVDTETVMNMDRTRSNAYMKGKKQLYYLNSISTRTHTALFIKEAREDGKGYAQSGNTYRLNEVILVDNQTYKDLLDPGKGNLNYGQNNILESGEVTTSAIVILNQQTIRKVAFSYSYELCQNVPNSSTGKLTLKRISMYGRNNFKAMPDYVFEYGFNPSYNKDKHDEWGMYYGANKADDGVAWNVTRITNPLGGSIRINYQRDTYVSDLGHSLAVSYHFNDDNGSWWGCSKPYYLDNTDEFRVGDKIKVKGHVYYQCGPPNPGNPSPPSGGDFSYENMGQVTSVSNGQINVSLEGQSPCHIFYSGNGNICVNPHVTGAYGYIEHTPTVRKGGDIRVASIITDDGNGNTIETRYRYTENEMEDGTSTGVASKGDPGFYDFPSMPVMYGKTTVLNSYKAGGYLSKQTYEFETPDYSMITLTRTCLNEDPSQLELISSNGYAWESESKKNKWKNAINSFLTRNKIGFQFNTSQMNFNEIRVWEFLHKYHIILDINTSKIGAIKAIKTYDKDNNLKAGTIFEYTSQMPGGQGIFTEGSLINERVGRKYGPNEEEYEAIRDNYIFHHRAIRTTKRFHPYVLQKITSTKDGFTSVNENKTWDFITGLILKTESKGPSGLRTQSETVPAYHIYPQMGSKAENSSNFNMMMQTAASYSYKLDAAGNRQGLAGASVQTWMRDYNKYRELKNGGYEDANVENHLGFKLKESYIWKGNIAARKSDGTLTFNENNRFNFYSSDNSGWQKTGEVSRYNHYAVPLEAKNMSGNTTCAKFDLQNRLKLLTASNASYTEVAWSGFESGTVDSQGNVFVDCELRISNSAQMNNTYAHTGEYSYKIVQPNEKGVFYNILNNSTKKEFFKEKNYRMSVWVNGVNSGQDQVELYYTVTKSDNTIQTIAGGQSSLHAGNWYLFNLLINKSDLVNAVGLEVGVKKKATANLSPVFIDDFRFQPANSTMSCAVYNQQNEMIYSLDNNNLYSRFLYDNSGRLESNYVEVLDNDFSKRERIVSSKRYNYGGGNN